ncbi:MAG: hypothetical protein JOZ16_05730 [Methylobacteriaceae bacterium]|nr:hypothetical protein [Methylobacteriaceae bacterium]
MSAKEHYFAVSFSRTENGELLSAAPQKVQDADAARKLAFHMSMSAAGGIAFYCTEAAGSLYRDAFILEEYGDVSLTQAEPELNPAPLIWWAA